MTPLRQLGRYELLFSIASGGMAEVFAARIRGEGGFEKLLAVKCMLPHLAKDEHFVSMFLDEGRLAASIASPNVVATHDLGRAADGTLFIAMDFVLGGSLRDVMRSRFAKGEAVPPAIFIEVMSQAAQGLHDAHQARRPTGEPLEIVHRDVSPHNILIGIDGRARISDFGIARAVHRLSSTSAGRLKGKFAYLSPEQARGETLDARSDVFSLGVVAWELAARRRLFFRRDTENLGLIQAVQRAPIPKLEQFGVPQPVAEVIADALNRDRSARVPDAAEFATRLRAAAATLKLAPATPAEVGQYIKDSCLAEITALEVRIRQSLSDTIVERTVEEGFVTSTLPDPPGPGVPDQTGAPDLNASSASLLGAPRGRASSDKHTVAELPSEPTFELATSFADPPALAPASAPLPKKRKSGFVLAAILAVVVVAGGVWSSQRPDVETDLVLDQPKTTTQVAETPPPAAVVQPAAAVEPAPVEAPKAPTKGYKPKLTVQKEAALDAALDKLGSQAQPAALPKTAPAPKTEAKAVRPTKRKPKAPATAAVAAPPPTPTAPEAVKQSPDDTAKKPAGRRHGLFGLDSFDSAAEKKKSKD